MQIKRFTEIEKYRLFESFAMKDNVDGFARLNVICGNNGSGKTTLSDFLFDISTMGNSLKFQIELNDGRFVNNRSLPKDFPQVIRFNNDYTRNLINSLNSGIDKIYYLKVGNPSDEKDKEILESRIKSSNESINSLILEIEKTNDTISKTQSNTAREIKRILSGNNLKYNTYTRLNIQKIIRQIRNNHKSFLLSDTNFQIIINSIRKEDEGTVKVPVVLECDISDLVRETSGLLVQLPNKQSEISQSDNIDLIEWLKKGMNLHMSKFDQECLFCGHSLDKTIIEKYRQLFDESYVKLIMDLDRIHVYINSYIQKIEIMKHTIYPDLSGIYRLTMEKELMLHFSDLESFGKSLKALLTIISKKRENIFNESVIEGLNSKLSEITMTSVTNKPIIDLLNKYNLGIALNNANKNSLREKIEYSLVAETIENSQSNEMKKERLDFEIQSLTVTLNNLQKELQIINSRLLDDIKPINKIQSTIDKYFYMPGLNFDVRKDRIYVLRNGEAAKFLSEGEKTILSFAYFIESIDHICKTLTFPVIVIDDPFIGLDDKKTNLMMQYLLSECKNKPQTFMFMNKRYLLDKLLLDMKHDNKDKDFQTYYLSRSKGIQNY